MAATTTAMESAAASVPAEPAAAASAAVKVVPEMVASVVATMACPTDVNVAIDATIIGGPSVSIISIVSTVIGCVIGAAVTRWIRAGAAADGQRHETQQERQADRFHRRGPVFAEILQIFRHPIADSDVHMGRPIRF